MMELLRLLCILMLLSFVYTHELDLDEFIIVPIHSKIHIANDAFYNQLIFSLNKNPSRSFAIHEIETFITWFEKNHERQFNETHKYDSVIRSLIDCKRLEFVGGGLVSHDETMIRYTHALNQISIGHMYLWHKFEYKVRVGWSVSNLPIFRTSMSALTLANDLGYDGIFVNGRNVTQSDFILNGMFVHLVDEMFTFSEESAAMEKLLSSSQQMIIWYDDFVDTESRFTQLETLMTKTRKLIRFGQPSEYMQSIKKQSDLISLSHFPENYQLRSNRLQDLAHLSPSEILEDVEHSEAMLRAAEIMYSLAVLDKHQMKQQMDSSLDEARRLVYSPLRRDSIRDFSTNENDAIANHEKLLERARSICKRIMSDSLIHLISRNAEIQNNHIASSFQYFDHDMHHKRSVVTFPIDRDDVTIPIVLFNTLSWNRDEMVELIIGADDIKSLDHMIDVMDSNGNFVQAQLLPDLKVSSNHFDFFRLLFRAKSVPALGSVTYFVTKRKKLGGNHYKLPSSSISTIMSKVILLTADEKPYHDDYLFNWEHFDRRKDLIVSHDEVAMGFEKDDGNLRFISKRVSDSKVHIYYISQNYEIFYDNHTYNLHLLIGYGVGFLLAYMMHILMIGNKIINDNDPTISSPNYDQYSKSIYQLTTNEKKRYSEEFETIPLDSSASRNRIRTLPNIAVQLTDLITAQNRRLKRKKGLYKRFFVTTYFKLVNFALEKKKYLSYLVVCLALLTPLVVNHLAYVSLPDIIYMIWHYLPHFIRAVSACFIGTFAGVVIALSGGVKKWLQFIVVYIIASVLLAVGQPWTTRRFVHSSKDKIVFGGPLVHEMNQYLTSRYDNTMILQQTRSFAWQPFIEVENHVKGSSTDRGGVLVTRFEVNGVSHGDCIIDDNDVDMSEIKYRYTDTITSNYHSVSSAMLKNNDQHVTIVSSQTLGANCYSGKMIDLVLQVQQNDRVTSPHVVTRIYVGNSTDSIEMIRTIKRHEFELRYPLVVFQGELNKIHPHSEKVNQDTDNEQLKVEETYIDMYKKKYHDIYAPMIEGLNINVISLQRFGDRDSFLIRLLRDDGNVIDNDGNVIDNDGNIIDNDGNIIDKMFNKDHVRQFGNINKVGIDGIGGSNKNSRISAFVATLTVNR